MEGGDWIGGLPPDAPRLLFGGRPEDDEHGREVARVAVAVAKGLGLPALTRSRLALAGRLHDIGKLEWPAALRETRVAQPGRLGADPPAPSRRGADLRQARPTGDRTLGPLSP